MSDLTRSINILSRVDLTGLIQLGMNRQADGKMDTWVFFFFFWSLSAQAEVSLSGLSSQFDEARDYYWGFFPPLFIFFSFFGGAKHEDA